MHTYEATVDALADRTRRGIVDLLREGDRSVGELAAELPVSRPAVSQHLAVLRRAALVSDRREGTRRIYRLEPDGFEGLRRYVESMWDRALAGFAAAAEREEEAMRMTEIEPVERTITVKASPERAFAVFTEGFGTWWPLDTHSIGLEEAEPGGRPATPQTAVIEPREGGRVFERHADGTELGWGTVTVWEPPRRLVMAWNPSREARPTTEVEVTFTAEGEGTRVELAHRGWERLGPRGADVREAYESGWPGVLARFAETAAG